MNNKTGGCKMNDNKKLITVKEFAEMLSNMKEHKFKGKIINPGNENDGEWFYGKLIQIKDDVFITAKLNDQFSNMYQVDIDTVEEYTGEKYENHKVKNMKKSDLKTGMCLENRNGEKLRFINGYFVTNNLEIIGIDFDREYLENLESALRGDDGSDIMKVFDDDKNLIWER